MLNIKSETFSNICIGDRRLQKLDDFLLSTRIRIQNLMLQIDCYSICIPYETKKRKLFSPFPCLLIFIFFYELAGSPFSVFIISIEENYRVTLNNEIWPFVHKSHSLLDSL